MIAIQTLEATVTQAMKVKKNQNLALEVFSIKAKRLPLQRREKQMKSNKMMVINPEGLIEVFAVMLVDMIKRLAQKISVLTLKL